MLITAEKLDLLKAIAEQVMLSGNYPARHYKTILMVTKSRQIYDRFDRDGTIASILTALIANVEKDAELFSGVLTSDVAPPPAIPPQQNDPFTEEALKTIGGKPDSSILNPPGAKLEGGDGYFPPQQEPKPGDIFEDPEGRRWKVMGPGQPLKRLPKVKKTEEVKDGNSG